MAFKTGESGNPGGRAKNALREYLKGKEALPEEIYEAVHPMLESKKGSERIWAAEFLRDSTWGKPAQMMEFVDAETFPFTIVRPGEKVA